MKNGKDTVTHTYDAAGRIIQSTSNDNDNNGNPADSQVVTYAYDSRGHLIPEIDEDATETANNFETRHYDRNGQLLAVQSPRGTLRFTESFGRKIHAESENSSSLDNGPPSPARK